MSLTTDEFEALPTSDPDEEAPLGDALAAVAVDVEAVREIRDHS
ncbi:MAG: hypothetical protein ABEJ34_00980 [Haloferacaceae archaeon]